MRFLHASHLIIAGRIELVVGDRRHLRLELIQLHGDIFVIQGLRRYRIGRVVDQDIRVYANLYKVYHVIVDDCTLIRYTVKP